MKFDIHREAPRGRLVINVDTIKYNNNSVDIAGTVVEGIEVARMAGYSTSRSIVGERYECTVTGLEWKRGFAVDFGR